MSAEARDSSSGTAARAVVLVGHGSAPLDAPRGLVGRLRALEAERRSSGSPVSADELELEARVRNWHRTPENDPYKAGMDAIAERLRARVGRVVVAYNEFCAPSLDQAIGALVRDGIREITVVTTMLTPGGVHSEVEIPDAVRALQIGHPGVTIRYAWPIDLDAIAGLLADACTAQTASAGG